MMYDKVMISAVVALLACTACEQPATQSADSTPQTQQDQAANDAAPVDQTTTDAANDMQTAAAIPLSDVENPEKTLANKQVKDSKGEAIGEVASVALNADGTVQMVTVNTGSSTVAMDASDLKYAQADATIISDKSKAEIEETPAE